MAKIQIIKDYKTLILKCDVYITTPPPRAQKHCRRERWLDCKKQWMSTKNYCSADETDQFHIEMHSACDSMHKICENCVKVNKI